MFKTISDKIGADKDLPERAHRLEVLGRVLDGTLYDHLAYPFFQEREEGTGHYIPIFQRRPSVRYRLCGTAVDDSVSLLFADGRMPAIECEDEDARNALHDVIKDAKLQAVMVQAATLGSVGSICLHLKVIEARVFVDVLPTKYLTPAFDPNAPDTLLKVTERYKVKGSQLADMGYPIADDDLGASFWFQREWDATAESWFQPVKVLDKEAAKKPPLDAARTVTHRLGFVPMVWIKNLPGGDAIDGAPTMVREAIDTSIEIDYLMSQGARGLRYASDPTLVIKNHAITLDSAPIVRSASQAIEVAPEGDAKLLEINGTAANAMVEYVRSLRELALESMHGNRANADKLSAAQSGRAMELMNQPLIWLADRLRTSYGEGGLLQLLRMIRRASQKIPLKTADSDIGAISTEADISLRWPKWFAPTYADGLTEAQTMTTLVDGRLLSQETAVKAIAPSYDVEDPAQELAQIKADQAEAQAQALAQAQAKAKAAQPPNAPHAPISDSED